jgi:ABC-type branched-subunit amino acid transport system permease subunit
MMDEKFQIEAAKFLERDFNQCFQQMRHYDSQIWEICKFIFGAYTVLLGAAIGVLKFSHENTNTDFSPVAIVIISVGFLIGIFMYCLTIRNRVYFVFVTRYINEHRRLFLSSHPLGFLNESGLYTNPKQPPFFDWKSSQMWLAYLIALLNSILITFMFFSKKMEYSSIGYYPFVLLFSVFLIQIAIAAIYLKSRENKNASEAVFPKE